ncbi:MAG: ArsR/SmtB family transcription factor [Ilumatobacteraceae bacterium]
MWFVLWQYCRMTIFEVLAEPNRRAILDLLLTDEQPVSTIVDALDIGQPTVSKHLKILREAGLVSMRIDANRRIYSLRPQPLLEVDDWLLPYRRRWARRLDALEQFLDEEAATTATTKTTKEGTTA